MGGSRYTVIDCDIDIQHCQGDSVHTLQTFGLNLWRSSLHMKIE